MTEELSLPLLPGGAHVTLRATDGQLLMPFGCAAVWLLLLEEGLAEWDLLAVSASVLQTL